MKSFSSFAPVIPMCYYLLSLMKKFFFSLACSLFLTVPQVLIADNSNPVEIPLVEIVSISGTINNGDSPMDGWFLIRSYLSHY